ncbi:MAG: B12-binding domain-containing protein [Maritimibacter sp.]
MSDEEDDLILSELNDEELVQQMHDDLYDGMKDEIEEATQILLDRGWEPYKVLTEGLVAGMQIVGVDLRDGILFVDILGMSALLTTTMPYMKVVIDEMANQGIRDDYIVLVGGAPLNEEFGKAIGADGYCRDAAVAVDMAKEFVARRHNQMA